MPNESPLTQALPDSLSHYFNKDPELLTEHDEMIIIMALREERKRYLTGEALKKSAPKRGPAPTALSLDDLDI